MESLYGLLGISPDSTVNEIGDALVRARDGNSDKATEKKILLEAQKFIQMGKEKYDELNRFTIENEQVFKMVNEHSKEPVKLNHNFKIEDERYKLREIRRNKKKGLYKDENNGSSFSSKM